MHGHQGKITAEAVKAVEILSRIELEKISAEVTVEKPLEIDLRWSDNKPAEDYDGNQDSQGSLFDKSACSPGSESIIYTRCGDDKEDWHYPEVTEPDKNIYPETGLGVINMPRVRIKKTATMEEEYHQHCQDP